MHFICFSTIIINAHKACWVLIVLVILNKLLVLVYSQSGGANYYHHMLENSVDPDQLASSETS